MQNQNWDEVAYGKRKNEKVAKGVEGVVPGYRERLMGTR